MLPRLPQFCSVIRRKLILHYIGKSVASDAIGRGGGRVTMTTICTTGEDGFRKLDDGFWSSDARDGASLPRVGVPRILAQASLLDHWICGRATCGQCG